VTKKKMRVLIWNVYVGQHPAKVRAALMVLALRHWPHVILLQEAKRFGGTIPGYRRHAADKLDVPDADNCIVLVREILTPQRGRPIPVAGPGWTHDKPKPPRVFSEVDVEGITFVSVHRCTSGMDGKNAAEWEAEHDALVTAGSVAYDAMVMAGDWNARPGRRHASSPAALARELDAEIVADDDEAIDYAIVRGVRATIAKLGLRFGSDHWPRLLTITRP
jgi:endonuclease/exonuclease/phosphatase (EEP) superfamily protein YafD